MNWRDNSFIQTAAVGNGWQWRQTGAETYTMWAEDPNGLPWTCTLEQSHTGDDGPSSSIEWICPALAIHETDVRQVLDGLTAAMRTDAPTTVPLPVPQLHIYYRSPKFTWKSLFSAVEPELAIEDSAGILDESLEDRLRHWPGESNHGPRLGLVRIEPSGLRVRSVNWWGSAPALVHQVALGIDLAARLRPHFSRC